MPDWDKVLEELRVKEGKPPEEVPSWQARKERTWTTLPEGTSFETLPQLPRLPSPEPDKLWGLFERKTPSTPGERIIEEWSPMLLPIPSALAGWRALSKAPTVVKAAGRVPLAPLAGVEKMGEVGLGLAKKAVVKVSTYMQKLEAHRMARDLKLMKEEYKKLAKLATGKTSTADMTVDEAEKFITALSEKGGIRDIQVPFPDISNNTAKSKAKTVAAELGEYLGRAKEPEKTVITKATRQTQLADNLKSKVQGFTARTYRIERVLDELDGYPDFPKTGKLTQVFWNSVDSGYDRKLMNTYQKMENFRNLLKEVKIGTKVLFGGQKVIRGVNFTTGERMGVYLHSMNPDNLLHMKAGNGFDDALIKETIDSLTPEEKRIADWVFKQWQDDTPKVAEAFKMTTGKNMKVVPDYVPIVIRGEDITFDDMLTKEVTYRYTKKYPSTMIKKGFTKARTGKAINPMELDVLHLFVNRLPEVEHYKTFAPILRDLQRIYNNPRFKYSFIKKAGKEQFDVLGQWMRDIAATNPLKARNAGERLAQQMRVNATTAVLGLNITTALKQFPSFVTGMADIGEMPALKGLWTYINHPNETMALIKRLAPQIWHRSFERELAETKLMKSIGNRVMGKLNWREVFMFMTTSMDRLAVNSLWRGAFDDAIKKGFNETIAAKYATASIRKTQPFFGIKDLAEYWRSSEIMKAMTMFTNQLNQNWNYYRFDIWGKWQAGKISNFDALRKIVEGFIIPALMIGAISRSRPAQDAKEFASDIGSMAFASVPIAGHYLSAGFNNWHDTQGLITTEILDQVQQFAYRMNPQQWDKIMENLPKIAETGAQMAGYMAGVPVTQPARTIKAMIELAQGNSDDLMRLIWGDATRKEAEKTQGGWRSKTSIPKR